MTRNISDLFFTHSNGDKIEVFLHFDSWVDRGSIDRVVFDDGTIWDQATINSMFPTATEGDNTLYGFTTADTINGLGGNDTIRGGKGDDVLDGGSGDDNIRGGDGGDIIVGGTGNDHMQGDAGVDTYTFDLDWGSDIIFNNDSSSNVDTISFGAGIVASDITVTRDIDDLFLAHSNGDVIEVDGHFESYNDRGSIDQVVFVDGTVWDQTTLETMAGGN